MPRAPDFWSRDGLLPALFAPAAALWGLVAGRRLRRPPRSRAEVPVVAVGNLVMGGAGKTPTTLWLAEKLAAAGCRPFVVTRGYGGRLAGPVAVDPDRHGPAEVGDEALMMVKRGAAVVVARDRPPGVAHAVAAGATHAILDDGFQSRSVAADFALLVVDAPYGIGNGRVFPAGPLRAPLGVQLAVADAVLLIGEGEADFLDPDKPVLRARLSPREPERWAGRRLFGYAGIGRPAKFRATLEDLGVDLAGFRALPDHHVIGDAEAAALLAEADRLGAGLVTTAKDRARLGRPVGGALAELAARSEVVEVDLQVDPAPALGRALAALAAARAR